MAKLGKKIVLVLYYAIIRKFPYQPLPGYKIGNKLRAWCAIKLFKSCGKEIVIKSMAYFGTGENIEIGDHSQLGINCKVEDDLILGDYVLMGPDVIIYSSSHKYTDPDIPVMLQGGKEKQSVVVGNDVWFGTRSIIMPGVHIGNHVIIGANSVVTHDIPDYAVVGGAPARIMKYRKRNIEEEEESNGESSVSW